MSLTFDSRTGFAAGASLTQMLSPEVSLEVDGLYVQKGFQASSGGESASMSLGYLEFPVLLRYHLGNSSIFPFLAGGASVAYKATCKAGVSGGGVSVSEACGEAAKGLDYGLVFGGGITKGALSGSIRYSYGLADIVDDPGSSWRNRVLMVLLAYEVGGQ